MASRDLKSGKVTASRIIDDTQFNVYDGCRDYSIKRASLEAKLAAIKQSIWEDDVFIDESFPIYYDECKKIRELLEVSSRPKNFRAEYLNPDNPWVMYDKNDSEDIQQGYLGDCWLVGAIANVGIRTDILSKIIVSEEYTPKGVYGLLLFHNGEWQEVIIDDRFLCEWNGQPACAHTRSKQLWVPLLEKAVAKIMGSYSIIQGSRSSIGFRTLTTCFSMTIWIRDPSTSGRLPEQKRKLATKHIYSAVRNDFLISSETADTSGDQSLYELVGLLPSHVYTVHDMTRVARTRLILLRNVWGHKIWTGDWCPDSGLWENIPDEKIPCQGKGSEYYGTFWMNMNDFFTYYGAVQFCNPSSDSFLYSLKSVMISSMDPQWGVLQFTVDEECSVNVGIVFTSSDSPKVQRFSTILALFDEDDNLLASTQLAPYRWEQTYIPSTLLPPGTYKTYCISFDSWLDWRASDFCYILHSTKEAKCKLVTEPTINLATVILRMTLSVGTSHSENEMQIYSLSSLFIHGTMLVAINFSSDDAYDLVTTFAFPNGNVRTTRGENSTIDTVPPLHSQIIQVAVAENPFERLSIECGCTPFPYSYMPGKPIDIRTKPKLLHQSLPLHRLLPNDAYMKL